MRLSYIIAKLIKKIHIPAVINSNVSNKSKICSASHFVNSSLNDYSYIGNNCTVIYSDIGKFCSIADNCVIGGSKHPIEWVSTSPVFHYGKNVINKNFSTNTFETMSRTQIGNDVWIGNNVLIKGGVSIGNGSIIGMGSIVTKDIGDYEIWGGNPAKLIRKRFTEDQITCLLGIKWWDLSETDLYKYGLCFNDIDQFISVFEKRRF